MRLLPSPLQSALLFAAWLLLNQSLAPGHLVLGALLAIGLPALLDPLVRPYPRLRRPATIARLAASVTRDVIVSNVEVARRILGPEAALRPGFVTVPLDIADPFAISTLAGIITMTPGTLSCAIAPDGGSLLVHALHLEDPDRLVADIKARYEAPLKEIFA
jgi:multicomponent K+:H+ antiporter subunit E